MQERRGFVQLPSINAVRTVSFDDVRLGGQSPVVKSAGWLGECERAVRSAKSNLEDGVDRTIKWFFPTDEDDDEAVHIQMIEEDMALARAHKTTTRSEAMRPRRWGKVELPPQTPSRSPSPARRSPGVSPASGGSMDGVCLSLPTDGWRTRWDLLLLVLTLYSACTVPVRACFDADAEGLLWAFEASISLVFLADMALTFNTALWDGAQGEMPAAPFRSLPVLSAPCRSLLIPPDSTRPSATTRRAPGRWVLSRAAVARHYLSGRFWLDAPASLPVELLELGAADDEMRDLLWLRLLRLARLLRLLRPLRVERYAVWWRSHSTVHDLP